MDRIIFHIDVNTAFVSWSAIKLLSEGYGKDIREYVSVVAGDEETRSGVVLARSMPAKKYGIYVPETLYSARRKYKDLITVRPDYEYYKESSDKLYNYLCDFTPLVERYSLDECYLDMTGTNMLFGDPIKLAYKIQSEIKEKFGFTVNIGIGNNKLCAKMASDFEKPNKVHTLFMNEIESKLWPLNVSDLYMVGKKTSEMLNNIGINTIGDLAKSDINFLRKYFKSTSDTIYNYANGIDNTKVGYYEPKNHSISNENTFYQDLITTKDLEKELLILSNQVGSRIRKEGYFAKTISIVFKNNEFKVYQHQISLMNPINTDKEIYEIAKELLNKTWKKDPIRLVGLRLSNFSKMAYKQTSLFDLELKKDESKIQNTMDKLKDKYGKNIITNASLLEKEKKNGNNKD